MLKQFFTMIVLAFIAVAAQATQLSNESIDDRTKPVGKVYLEGDKIPQIKPVVKKQDGPRSGEDVYNTACAACHSTGAAGAPKTGDVAGWTALIARGIDDLLASAIKGKGAMPPRGLCTSCSDDELKAAIQHMMDNSK